MTSTDIIIDQAELAKTIGTYVQRFQARLLKVDDLAAYLSCSKLYAKKLAEYCGAVRRIGASWYADRVVLDQYIADHPGELVDPETVAAWRAGGK